MPCKSEYSEPNALERESKLVAELLVYVLASLQRPIPEGTVFISKNGYGKPEAADSLTAELCALCRNMTQEQQDEIIYDGRNHVARQLADWLDRHKKFDKKNLPSWVVQVHGTAGSESFEISVINKKKCFDAQLQYGWFDKNKLLISHNCGPCRWTTTQRIWDKLINVAKETIDELNEL